MTTGTSVPARVVRWWAAALVLTLIGLGCVLLWTDRSPEAAAVVQTEPAPAEEPTTEPATEPAPDLATESATEPPSSEAPEAPVDGVEPVQLTIPAMQLDTRLITLGLQPDNTVEVPSDPLEAGWFRRGPAPGSVGSAVILGHVDSVDGPAVFYTLKTLTTGAKIRVGLDDGSVATFKVRSVTTYDNEAFPAKKVYGSHGRRELNLVTCGGDYDAAQGGYQSNVVVNARWVSTAAA